MADAVAHQPVARRDNSQQLAWGVLLLAFAIFCVIVIFVIVGMDYFLFRSRVPMGSIVQVARGTAALTSSNEPNPQAVSGEREITTSVVLTTDTTTQASFSFFDQQQDDQLIATVTLMSRSSLRLREDSRPRFSWSSDEYWIDFEDASGEFDIFVPKGLPRPILITFETALGPAVRLSASGRYTLVASGSQVQVMNYDGEALLSNADRRSQFVPVGQSVAVQVDTGAFTAAPTLANLLGETGFSSENVIDYNAAGTSPTRPLVWRCNNVQDAPPVGSYALTIREGRPALSFLRGDGAQSHGETRCWQGLGTGAQGLDVSMFSHMSIRATFQIANQTLSACGDQGSECPLMLAMDYIPYEPINDQNPVNTWYHGFYAFVDPNRVYPQLCQSCIEQHENINPGVWYTYESRNLSEIFAPERRPRSILNLRFYASGHEYEVYISELELLVDQAEIPLPVIGG